MESVSESFPWNEQIASLPGAHILQTRQWGRLKAQFGWKPAFKVWPHRPPSQATLAAAALILTRDIRIGGLGLPIRVMYVPKGPLLDWKNEHLRGKVLSDLLAFARQQRAFLVKIDPDVRLGTGFPNLPESRDDEEGISVVRQLRSQNWRLSGEQIQYRNTIILDLTSGASELLARMKQKTRYNIRLAGRRGVRVRVGSRGDFDLLYRMYVETSRRDGFVIRPERYYQAAWGGFLSEADEQQPSGQAGIPLNRPQAKALIAEVEGEAVAALVLYAFAGRAWYLYGMSRGVHREKMPNHLLQWEAIRMALALGCEQYDLWGAPETNDREEPMWGVYRFKQGFGGELVRNLGAWDYALNPGLYRLFTSVLPRVLKFLRFRKRAELRRGSLEI